MVAFAQPTNMEFQDPEQLALQRKLLEAEALRKGGMSDSMGEGYRGGRVFIVGNPLGNLAKSIGGAYLGDKAEQAHNALIGQRNAEEDAFLAARPSEMMTQTSQLQGPTETGAALSGTADVQVAKPYQQLAQETRDWTAKAPRYSPLAGALRQAGMMQAVNAPEKLFEREEAGKIRTESERVRLAAAREMALEKQAAEEKRDRERAQDRKDQARLVASLRPARETKMQVINTVDDNGNPIQKVVELKPGDSYPSVSKGDKTSGKKEANASALRILDNMSENISELEKGGGYVSGKMNIAERPLTYLANTGAMQEVQRAYGGKNQTQRDMLESRRMQLLTELKQAKGLSASEMNSNFELQKRLEALGGGRMNIDALKEITDDTRELFGGERKFNKPKATDAPVPTPSSSKAPADVDAETWKYMTPEEKALWQQ